MRMSRDTPTPSSGGARVGESSNVNLQVRVSLAVCCSVWQCAVVCCSVLQCADVADVQISEEVTMRIYRRICCTLEGL